MSRESMVEGFKRWSMTERLTGPKITELYDEAQELMEHLEAAVEAINELESAKDSYENAEEFPKEERTEARAEAREEAKEALCSLAEHLEQIIGKADG